MNQNDKRLDEFLGDFKLLCKQYEIVTSPVTLKYAHGDHSSAEMSCTLHLQQYAHGRKVITPAMAATMPCPSHLQHADDSEVVEVPMLCNCGEDYCPECRPDKAGYVESQPHHVITRATKKPKWWEPGGTHRCPECDNHYDS